MSTQYHKLMWVPNLIHQLESGEKVSDAGSATFRGITVGGHLLCLEDLENIMDVQRDGEYLRWYLVPPADGTVCPFYQSVLRRDMEGLFGRVNRSVVDTPNDVTPRAVLRLNLGAGSEGAAKQVDGLNDRTSKHSPPITTSTHSCQAKTLCYWMGDGKYGVCGAKIACKSVPVHLRDVHHIRKMDDNSMVCCRWEGCGRQMKRKNFSRHVRECHVGHCREQRKLPED